MKSTESLYHATEKFGKIEPTNLFYREIYSYNKKGNKTEYNLSYVSNEGKKKVYVYNGLDVEIEETMFAGTANTMEKRITKYRIDEKENISEYNTYTSDGKLFDKTINQFNNNGKLFESSSYDGYGKLWVKVSYSYNEQGNIVKKTDFYTNYQVITEYKYENFDSNGNWLKRIDFVNGKPTNVITRELTYF
jgi:hypothetical protein